MPKSCHRPGAVEKLHLVGFACKTQNQSPINLTYTSIANTTLAVVPVLPHARKPTKRPAIPSLLHFKILITPHLPPNLCFISLNILYIHWHTYINSTAQYFFKIIFCDQSIFPFFHQQMVCHQSSFMLFKIILIGRKTAKTLLHPLQRSSPPCTSLY